MPAQGEKKWVLRELSQQEIIDEIGNISGVTSIPLSWGLTLAGIICRKFAGIVVEGAGVALLIVETLYDQQLDVLNSI